MGNLTNWVPSTYLPAHFHALSQKMALDPFWAHQPIYRHFHRCPFGNGKFDQLVPINLSTGTFSRTIPKNGFESLLSPTTYLPAFSRMEILSNWIWSTYPTVVNLVFVSTHQFSRHNRIFFWLYIYKDKAQAPPPPKANKQTRKCMCW